MSTRNSARRTAKRRTSLPRRSKVMGFAGMLTKLGLASSRLQMARSRHR